VGRNDKHRIRVGFVWIANWLPVNGLPVENVTRPSDALAGS